MMHLYKLRGCSLPWCDRRRRKGVKRVIIRFDLRWHKNCRTQLDKKAKICGEYSFRRWIEQQEKKNLVSE